MCVRSCVVVLCCGGGGMGGGVCVCVCVWFCVVGRRRECEHACVCADQGLWIFTVTPSLSYTFLPSFHSPSYPHFQPNHFLFQYIILVLFTFYLFTFLLFFFVLALSLLLFYSFIFFSFLLFISFSFPRSVCVTFTDWARTVRRIIVWRTLSWLS